MTQEDLADLAVDDLVELTGMDEERAKQLIMTARALGSRNEWVVPGFRMAQMSVAQFLQAENDPARLLSSSSRRRHQKVADDTLTNRTRRAARLPAPGSRRQ
jgi:transcription termination factor NusA